MGKNITLKMTICCTKVSVIFILFFFQLFASVTPLDISRDTLAEQPIFSSIPSISDDGNIATIDISKPLFKLQSFQTPSILFIVSDDSSPDQALDEPFYDFMSINLSFNVIYHTANNSYNYTDFDAIVMSNSVEEEGTAESLEDATIPILTMEAGHWDEFYLGDGFGVTSNYIDWVLKPNPHYIIDEEVAGIKTIYSAKGVTNYLQGYDDVVFPLGCDIQQLAYHDSPSALKYASLVALEKEGLRYDLNKSAERRAFWGASSVDKFLPDTWSLLNKTLHWTLYDDYLGNATITVNVQDLDSNDVSNADVELIDSNNISISWSEKTSQTGSATFTNISWGEYDIKVSFRSIENNSLTNLQIVPLRTYMKTSSFEYSVIINDYVDNVAPEIDNVYFDSDTLTFFARVTDDSTLKNVFLNLTAHNLSTGLTEIPLDNFTMIWGPGNNYLNMTSLDSLSGTLVNITYNIIAEDVAGNYYATEILTFDLDDPIPPNIWSYESQDYGNGTISFTANVTDENGIQAPVILEINDTYYDMYQEESNLWVFRGMFDYDVFLNYTLYSVSDTVGNENGSSIHPLLFPYKNITTTDTTPPRISALSDTFALHEEGFVEFTVHIDDWSTYQSGVNFSQIIIILMVNGEIPTPFDMIAIGEITFVFDYIFYFNDNVTYWISAYDNANNCINSTHRGPYRVDDNMIPSVSFSAIEYGNGTIEFFAQVLDWPNNDTSAQIFFTNDYFAVDWTNESMIKLNSTTFQFSFPNFPFQIQAIWYYANALDSENNLYDTQIESAQSLQLTDSIAPVIQLTYLNSSSVDGEITLFAQATDPYGSIFFLNNSISLNISSILVNLSIPMTFDEGTTYIYSTSYTDQTKLNITAYVSDTNGNVGSSYLSLLVADIAPPTILQFGIESFINGTLTIFAEVVDGINGSGLLDDNSSVTLNYVFTLNINKIMTWNGTGNYFSYPIPGLTSNNAFLYRFIITDKLNNIIVTEWIVYIIADTVAPVIIGFNTTETQKDQILTEIFFWVNSIDEYGEIREVILNYSILLPEGWLNYSETMSQAGQDYYENQVIFLSNSTIRYQIIVIDTFSNSASTDYNEIILTGFIPSQFGVNGNSFYINNPGECKVWITVIDNFDEHLHNVTITVTDLNTSYIILDNIKMNSEGLNYSISIEVAYLDQFSYSFKLVDQGALNGFYDAIIRNSTVLHMLDYWSPTIHEVGVNKISDEAYLFWANVTDWGSGEDPHTLDVILNFDLETVSGGGSEISNTFKQKRMIFNGSLFETNITFNNSGTLVWSVIASDSFSSSDSYPGTLTPVVLDQVSPPGFNIEWIIAAIVVTSLAILLIMSIVITLRRRKSKKIDRKQSFVDKLNFPSNIYTIMVSSSVGIPIWSKTNVLYRADDTMNGNLSGLSVGIDSFLDSFQSDFLTQVHGSPSQSTSQTKENIKISVIEQNKVQIMILGSTSYRIFVFMKEIPSKFIRNTFLNIIKDMEHNLPLMDLGIVDEDLQGPLVESVIKNHLPVGLLDPFKIDLDQLSDFDEKLRSQKGYSGMTRNGVNVLKILSISHLVHSSSKNQNKQALLKMFNHSQLSASQIYSRIFLFKDAVNIVNNLGKFAPEELYDAFWTGTDEKVKILVEASST